MGNGIYHKIDGHTVAKGYSSRGLKISGTARGSSEFATLTTTEVPLTFDRTLINAGNTNDVSMVVLLLKCDQAMRISEEENGTDDNTAYWPIDANSVQAEYIIARADSTLYLRTEAGTGQLWYRISFV